jgi:hypothetical protein
MALSIETTAKHLDRYPSLEEDVSDLLDVNMYPPFSDRRNAKIQVKCDKEVSVLFFVLGPKCHLGHNSKCNTNGNASVAGEHQTVKEVIKKLRESHAHLFTLRYHQSLLSKLRVHTDRAEEKNDEEDGDAD